MEVASSLSSRQLAFLANGPKYVPACQSRFSRLPMETMINRELLKIVECFKSGFGDNCVSITDQRATEFFASIDNSSVIFKSNPYHLEHWPVLCPIIE